LGLWSGPVHSFAEHTLKAPIPKATDIFDNWFKRFFEKGFDVIRSCEVLMNFFWKQILNMFIVLKK
jgi:hypothetical protein